MKTRSAAARVIASLLNQQGSLSALLPEAMGRVAERDRPLLQELCYGTCRWQPQLQCFVDLLVDKPLRNKDRDVVALMLIGLYQLIYLRIPDHAAISATVQAAQALKKPWAKGLINGVLRRYQREGDALRQRLQSRSEYRHAHPGWMVESISAAWPEHAEQIFTANNLHPPLTLRVNRRQTSREDYLKLLNDQGIAARATPFSADGITLEKGLDVETLPRFAEGAVSVQDEAAQLSAVVLDLQPGQQVLDACCAPGGKTAHILEREGRLQRLVALDISEQRLERTRQNLQRLQLDAELLVADATKPATWSAPAQFDRILVDAPCSATGVIRRHPDIKLLRNRDDVDRLLTTQRALLDNIWPLLKPGGLLIYATCSILPAENSTMVAGFVDSQPNAQHLSLGAEWGVRQAFGRQLLPQADGHDGFYFARLRKAD
jgi:16S rRNA (cytosine967-C5)-methyltransferase